MLAVMILGRNRPVNLPMGPLMKLNEKMVSGMAQASSLEKTNTNTLAILRIMFATEKGLEYKIMEHRQWVHGTMERSMAKL